MSPLDDPRGQQPATYFERMEAERREHERREQETRLERREQDRREHERRERLRRRWRTGGVAAAVVVALAAAGGIAFALAGGQQDVKIVRLIVTQPLGQTPAATITVVASGSVAGVSTSPTSQNSGKTHTGSSSSGSGASKASSGSGGAALNIQAAEQAARAAGSGTQVGFAVFDSSGQELGSYDDTMENYGASITKAMLLVAYLQQVGSGPISSTADESLTQMIEASDNASADDVYHLLNDPQAEVQHVASDAGMTGFQLDTSDPVYVLGQSKITARDFALFFSKIDQMIPAGHRSYALNLLSHLDGSDQVGLLQSGLPGTVYSKEGWKGEPTISGDQPYVVNQAAQFQMDGTTYGVAVTVAQDGGSQSSNEAIIQRIGAALIR
ncbi:MAG: serine hydrolase [Solirubrobacteraceae bacterium]